MIVLRRTYIKSRSSISKTGILDGPKTYFVTQDGDSRKGTKIGKANRVSKRLKLLQTGNPAPLRINGLIFGDVERELHKKFRHFQERGEWFKFRFEIEEEMERRCDLFTYYHKFRTPTNELRERALITCMTGRRSEDRNCVLVEYTEPQMELIFENADSYNEVPATIVSVMDVETKEIFEVEAGKLLQNSAWSIKF